MLIRDVDKCQYTVGNTVTPEATVLRVTQEVRRSEKTGLQRPLSFPHRMSNHFEKTAAVVSGGTQFLFLTQLFLQDIFRRILMIFSTVFWCLPGFT